MLVSRVMRLRVQPHSPGHKPYRSREKRVTSGRPQGGDKRGVSKNGLPLVARKVGISAECQKMPGVLRVGAVTDLLGRIDVPVPPLREPVGSDGERMGGREAINA